MVAADGLRSRSRRLLGIDSGLHYCGYTAWRGVTEHPMSLGGRRDVGPRPGIRDRAPPDNQMYWFATESTPEGGHEADEKTAVLDRFGTWYPPIRECIDNTPAESILRHDIYDLAKMPSTFVRNRTVLLGDAAHAMTPNLGQAQARPSRTPPRWYCSCAPATSPALARHDRIRRARTRTLWRQSRLMGKAAQAANSVAVHLRNSSLRATPPAIVSRSAARVAKWTSP